MKLLTAALLASICASSAMAERQQWRDEAFQACWNEDLDFFSRCSTLNAFAQTPASWDKTLTLNENIKVRFHHVALRGGYKKNFNTLGGVKNDVVMHVRVKTTRSKETLQSADHLPAMYSSHEQHVKHTVFTLMEWMCKNKPWANLIADYKADVRIYLFDKDGKNLGQPKMLTRSTCRFINEQ